MPHLAHKRVPGTSHRPSPVAGHPTPPHEPQSPEQEIDYDGWPHFASQQSLSDDTTQLHLTLQTHSSSPSPSPSPGSSPLLSRQPSSGGDSGGSAPASVTASPRHSVAPLEPSLLEKQYAKKKNRLSAGALASLLPVSHDDDRKRARKERKHTEKLARHEQTIQELRTADRRRAYFRDASHRRKLVFGPEVRYAPFSYNQKRR